MPNERSTYVNLSCGISNISYFDSVKKTYDTDKYLAAKPDGTPQSYSTNYSALTSYLLNGLENVPAGFAPQGQWDFLNAASMIYISVDNITNTTDVPNLRYIEEHLLSALYDLSSSLYDEDKMNLPSYVGQVILGNRLENLAAVRKIYGAHTNWQKIEGRFLLGTGSCKANSTTRYGSTQAGEINVNSAKTTGGQCKVKLIGLPSHTHIFSGMHVKKAPASNPIGFSLEKEEGEAKTYHKMGEFGKYSAHDVFRPRKRKYMVSGEATETLVEADSTVAEESFTFKFAGTISDNDASNSMKNEAHNNIPPFQCTYIWERIE